MARRRYDDDYDFDDDYDDRPRAAAPPNYLVQSILCTLFCCWLFGIIAIVYAAQVDSKWAGGDYAGARDASAKARMWCWWSFWSVFVIFIVYVLFIVVIAVAGK